MRVLITGICGFAGSTIAKRWIETVPGLTVYGIDSFIRQGSELNREGLVKLGVKIFHGDIRSQSDMDALPPVDWVIDAAANPSVLAGVDGQMSSRELLEHNLFGTVNILEYCKRHNAGFILLSTSRVYSITALSGINVETTGDAFLLDTSQPMPQGLSASGVSESFITSPPLSLYGSAKLASETLALEYGDAFGFPVWINRCGVLAGAGQFGRADQGIFAYWINAYIRRYPLTYIGFGGKGHQVRDCLHAGDLVPLLVKQTAPGASAPTRTVNLGGGTTNAISLAGLSAWCAERFGPHTVAAKAETRRFDIPWMVMDSALAGSVWGWQPETPLPAILEEIALHAEAHPDWLEISGAR